MKKLLVVMAGALVLAPAALATGPVPSLTPAATQKLWRAEVARAKAHPRALADGSCRPARVIFYAETDWLRLATRLAANESPCAQYYVSVPPLAASKTQPRANQASQIRALGANFHALDEISWNGWSSWVTTNNETWYDAGVQARQLMAAAGFDTASGDTWGLNELSSAVRAGTGTARQNALDFMRGLSSDGVKGVVWIEGIGQTSDPTTYKANLESWFQDSGFWSAVAQYASDWAQEDYGDVRAYAVAGSSPQQRRDAELQYLGHELTLAEVAPETAAAAQSFLQSSYVAFGNAAWAWASGYGWTSVPVATMQDFVSGQVYAGRSLGAPSGVDRFGFAWAPQNSLGLSTTDYNAQTQAVLDRIAGAIHDTALTPVDPTDPGAAACAPSWCTTSVDGAAFTSNWQTFSTWSTPATPPPAGGGGGGSAAQLVVTSTPASFAAGASTPVSVQVSTAPESVTFSTSSATGGFAGSAAGPFTPMLTATIPAGASTLTVYYRDTAVGAPAISAALPGQTAVTTSETVVAGPVAKLAVSPVSATVATAGRVTLTTAGADAYGNAVPATPAWRTSAGKLSSPTGASVTLVAPAKGGKVTVTASSGAVKATAVVTVVLPPPRVHSVGTKSIGGHLVVTTSVLRGAAPAAGVPLTLRVRKGSSTVAIVKGVTGRRGTFSWRSKSKLPRGRYVARALIRSASTASRTQQSRR
ncbi:MAG TPA: hypothetical protein VHV52_01950 [Gaiellaceae bacterium]|nr:hypothetical protein [Gaiellaceae bacterium]